VTQQQAQSLGLATVNGNNFILRADDTTTLNPSGPGRNSFRIISGKQWGTHVSVWVVKFSTPQSLASSVNVGGYIVST